MSAVPTTTSPADGLQQEQQAARTLIDLLQQEQALLITASIDELALVTERKGPIVAQMSELAIRRHRLLPNVGFAASELGMQAWVQHKVDGKSIHPAAVEAWTTLMAMARQAQELNRINGLLINTHMARNQSALNVLRTESGSGSGNFYGPDGQSTSRGRGRGLVVG